MHKTIGEWSDIILFSILIIGDIFRNISEIRKKIKSGFIYWVFPSPGESFQIWIVFTKNVFKVQHFNLS